MKRFRIIKRTYPNDNEGNNVEYVIEKRRLFLPWLWKEAEDKVWSPQTPAVYDTLEEAIEALKWFDGSVDIMEEVVY